MERFASSIKDLKKLTDIMNQMNEKARTILDNNKNNLDEAITFTVDFDQKMNNTLQICADLTKFLIKSESSVSRYNTVESTSSMNQLQEATVISTNDIDKYVSESEVCSSVATVTDISTSSIFSNEDEHTFNGEISDENSENNSITTSTVPSTSIHIATTSSTITSTSITTATTTPTSTHTLKYNVDRQRDISALCFRNNTLDNKENIRRPSTSYPDISKMKRSIFTTTASTQTQHDQEMSPTGDTKQTLILSSILGLNDCLAKLSLEESNVINKDINLENRTEPNSKMFPNSRYIHKRQNKVCKPHVKNTIYTKSKTNMKNRLTLTLLNSFNIRKDTILYFHILYPDGMTVPGKFSSSDTIAELIKRLEDSDPLLQGKPHEIVTYCPHRIITSMPRSFTLWDIGLKNKSFIVIRIL